MALCSFVFGPHRKELLYLFIFSAGEACTIVLRGATEQILEEAERSLHDVLCVLTTHVKEAKTVAGAGASEILMSTAVVVESQKVRYYSHLRVLVGSLRDLL